ASVALVLAAIILLLVLILGGDGSRDKGGSEEEEIVPEMPSVEVEENKVELPPVPTAAGDSALLGDEIDSTAAIVVERETGAIVAAKNPTATIYPASMTKVLALIVAVEEIEELSEKFTMTAEIIDPVYREGATTTGIKSGEAVPLEELLYAMILPSGADAADALAIAACGSTEAFVDKMNEKVAELGLSESAHFANANGLHDENQYCSVRDMAMIFEYAMREETCRKVLSTMYFTTTPTEQHPEGVSYTNLYLYRIEGREMNGATVLAGKTGYVAASGSCIASCGAAADGSEYIVVTADASGSWKAIYDHIDLYGTYAK
ncbi:MAG: D-alanyl-D-alanine carboxypeptidase, partial [Oscillospiraceae bacterium]|nr:D-alanyl-D-alanine carboxypeptidase [Oscillospiraceae bacterium]